MGHSNMMNPRLKMSHEGYYYYYYYYYYCYYITLMASF